MPLKVELALAQALVLLSLSGSPRSKFQAWVHLCVLTLIEHTYVDVLTTRPIYAIFFWSLDIECPTYTNLNILVSLRYKAVSF
jgi:hypothetical protein